MNPINNKLKDSHIDKLERLKLWDSIPMRIDPNSDLKSVDEEDEDDDLDDTDLPILSRKENEYLKSSKENLPSLFNRSNELFEKKEPKPKDYANNSLNKSQFQTDKHNHLAPVQNKNNLTPYRNITIPNTNSEKGTLASLWNKGLEKEAREVHSAKYTYKPQEPQNAPHKNQILKDSFKSTSDKPNVPFNCSKNNSRDFNISKSDFQPNAFQDSVKNSEDKRNILSKSKENVLSDINLLKSKSLENISSFKPPIPHSLVKLSSELLPLTSSKSSPEEKPPLKEDRHIPQEQKQVKHTEHDLKPLNTFKMPTPISNASKNVVLVNNKQYKILSIIGKGGSCKVYEVFSMELKCTLALKLVKLENVDESVKEDYRNEINLLKTLQHLDTVIKMYDFQYKGNEIHVILEKGDSDFASMLNQAQTNKQTLNPIFIKFYWQEMVKAVNNIHKAGIVHTDLKPANFLLVQGKLKLIDFGIACKIQQEATSCLKENAMGTMNYMSPEAIQEHSSDIKYRITFKSDVWSLGCILYKMVYGHPPFGLLQGTCKQITAIINPNYQIKFAPIEDQNLLNVLKSCLLRDSYIRISSDELLTHPYLTQTFSPSLNTDRILQSLDQLSSEDLQTVYKAISEKIKRLN